MTFAAAQIVALVTAARRTGVAAARRRVPNARPPRLIESDYAAALVGLVGQLREATRHIVDALPDLLRLDDSRAGRARKTVERVRAELDESLNTTALEGIAERAGRRVAGHTKEDLVRQGRAALGVDVVTLDPKVPTVISGFVHENVSLIKSLHGRTLDHLETIVTRAVADGTRAEVVQAEIEARFGVAERHARLIARDQIGKLTSQITEARHRELGIQSYEWQHIGNKNPRLHHVARHGKRFRYDDPPADGHPGRAICCHCLQKPVFDDLVEQAGPPPRVKRKPAPPAKRAAAPPVADSGLNGPIVSTRKLGGGLNVSRIVKYGDGSAAVWKPSTGEVSDFAPPGIPPGTMYQREAAAYRLARVMNIDVVPETVTRTHKGVEGSMQRFVKATPSFKFKAEIDRDSAEQMRLMDFVAGNQDRHVGNLIVSRDGRAVAIDNGQAFPTGRAGPQQPPAVVTPFAGRGLLDTTRARIAAMDLEQIAATLHDSGMEPDAVRHTLYRARLLKERPDTLSVPEGVGSRPPMAQGEVFIDAALTAETSISPAGKALADRLARRPR